MYIFCTGDMYMLCIGRGVCIYYLIIINRLIYLRDLQKIHNNKYGYSKVEYINNSIKVKIICYEHGEFLQSPGSHLSGKGCKQCGKKRTKEKSVSFKAYHYDWTKGTHRCGHCRN
mgnify:CR=1 FL=1